MTIDLHIHSTYSDGSMSPAELVKLGSVKGLSALAITDHDTIDGTVQAKEAGEKYGVEIIPGVELSVKYSGYVLHILGYYFDIYDKPLRQGLLRLQVDRLKRNEAIISRLRECDINIDLDELKKVSKIGLTGRPHIGQLLIQKRIVRSMDEAFDRFLGQRGVAYVSRSVYRPEEALALIKNAKGLSVLAHPLQVARAGADLSFVIRQLAGLGLDGIEIYYPTHSRKNRKLLRKYAVANRLIETGGSDYHGNIRPGTTMAWGRKFTVPDEVLKNMKQRAVSKVMDL